MKIIGLNGSPQKEGNTVTLLNEALKAVAEQGAETHIIHLADELIGLGNPFCFNCAANCEGACFKGTRLEKAYDMLTSADGIILGSPVYFGTVSAQMKAFWDKTRWIRKGSLLLNVVGGAISVGTSRFGGQEATVGVLHDIMLVHGMTIVGDGYIGYDCGHQGGCAQKPAEEDEYGLKRARILGLRVLEVAKATVELRQR